MADLEQVDWRDLPEADAIVFLIDDLGMTEREARLLYAIETGIIQGDATTIDGDDPYLRQIDRTNL